MQLIIKQLTSDLSEQEKQYLRKRFLWLKEHLGGSSVLTVGIREHITKKSNQAYEIILHLVKTGVRKPIYIRTYGNDFRTAVDRAKDKIERIIIKKKERGLLRLRIPRLSFRRKAK
jgi:ribosome-associated translation inhibitor RaiA